MDFVVREIAVDELHKIAKLSQEIWPISYKEIISEAQITYMLNWMYSEETLTQNLLEGHRFFIAESLEKPLGFVGFQCDHPVKGNTKLHKLYVLPNLHQKGIGKALTKCVIHASKEKECKHITLQVNKKIRPYSFTLNKAFTNTKRRYLTLEMDL